MARMFDRSHRRRARLARETRFTIENLERRQVMAANLVASLMPDGVLRVEGTPARDWIEVRQAGGQVSVTGAAIAVGQETRASVSVSDIARIELKGGEGNDFFAIYGIDTTTLPLGISISGDQGRDAFVVPSGVTLDAESGDRVFSTAEMSADALHQSRIELLYKFRDRWGYVGHFDTGTGLAQGDGEGTLYTAIAAIGIATGNYHQDAWESAEANAVLEDLLGTLLTKSWGNRDEFGREHPIRHPNVYDYDASGNAFRQSPMSKDSFGAIVAAAHYAHDNPHSSEAVRELARDLIAKWSNYLVSNQWRTHSRYIVNEFETDGNMYVDGGHYKHIFDENGVAKSAKGPESFQLLWHEAYALRSVATRMGVAVPTLNLTNALSQTVVDLGAEAVGNAVGRGVRAILDQLSFSRDYDVKIRLGNRDISVLKGDLTIGIPTAARERMERELSGLVTNVVREGMRLGSIAGQADDMVSLAVNRLLDHVPNQLGRSQWRAVLVEAISAVVPALRSDILVEAGCFMANLLMLARMNKADVTSYSFWSYAVEMETRPEMADLLRPAVQAFYGHIRSNDNPNSLWAWLAEDKGRVNEQLRWFESRILAGERFSQEFAYSSTEFAEFQKRSEAKDGGAQTKFFPRLDYVVVSGLREKGQPKAASDDVADAWKTFTSAAEEAFNQLVTVTKQAWNDLRNDLGRLAGVLVRELKMGVGDVATIVFEMAPDLGRLVEVLRAANVGWGDIAAESWKRAGGDLARFAASLRNAGAGIGEVAVQSWARAGGDLGRLAGSLRAAGAGWGDVAAESWNRAGGDLGRFAVSLRNAGAGVGEVAMQSWARAGGDLGRLAGSLRAAGAGWGDVAAESWNRAGGDLGRFASSLRNAGAGIGEVAAQSWARAGGDLGRLVGALRAAGGSWSEVARETWNRTSGDLLGRLNAVARATGNGIESVASAVGVSIPVPPLPKLPPLPKPPKKFRW